MKNLMIIGAMIGFLTGVLMGLSKGTQWPEVLWRASVASLVAGYLFRWWGRAWLNSLRQAQQERLAADELQTTPPAKV